MARVRWCGRSVVIGVLATFWIFTAGVIAECWYDDEKHEEGSEVETAEPCLNCTCSRGALLCYLRVCPRLPNPPPPGCILLHRYRTCCPELLCAELPGGGNAIEARSDTGIDLDIVYDYSTSDTACIANGSIYGSGSAMDSSSLCEYCYCLRGKQTCVKPKCLLSIDGCTPIFESTSCCPVHYKCTSKASTTTTSSTTTRRTTTTSIRNVDGCTVEGIVYPEGGKILGVGHSVCDNCYCLRGLLRCEPLSCAPPLLGCTPVIKPGECCAASYNCNGTIEIEPEPNYGLFPIVSKEYAKLRKEVQRKPTKYKEGVVTVPPFYVLAESLHPFTTNKVHQRSPDTFGTTRHFTGVPYNPSSPKPFFDNNNKKSSTESYQDVKKAFATTNFEYQNSYYKRLYSTTTKSASSNPNRLDVSINPKIISINKLNRKVDSNERIETTTMLFTDSTEDTTVEISTSVPQEDQMHLESKTTTENYVEDVRTTTDDFLTTNVINNNDKNNSISIILKTVLKSTDCVYNDSNIEKILSTNQIEATTLLPIDPNSVNNLAETKEAMDFLSTTTDFEDASTEYTSTEDEITSKETNTVTLRILPNSPFHQLNISKNKKDNNDYEFDYNEPTLPPSLPNLRIIPFVAADALDAKKEVLKNHVYVEDKLGKEPFLYTNLFNPPVETEGGFIPKDPLILNGFYDNAVTASSSEGGHCDLNGKTIKHGSSVPPDSPCLTCTCFYGNVICQKPNCPLPPPGCKNTVEDLTLCCPNYICANPEQLPPPLVAEPLEVLSPPPEKTPDPFKDVIRTEPAPNLQSLIGDIKPFLHPHTTRTPLTDQTESKHTTTSNKIAATNSLDDMSLDKVLELILYGKNEPKTESATKNSEVKINKIEYPSNLTLTEPSIIQQVNHIVTTTTTSRSATTEKRFETELNNVNTSVGLLKLAGCNIYGRMYRVGRIISELSNPCLECKCTEIGVQCRDLKC